MWTVLTWDRTITHDAGLPEWIDTPLSELSLEELAPRTDIHLDGEMLAPRLAQPLYLFTTWFLDEVFDQLYMSIIDPRGITLHRELRNTTVDVELPSVHMKSIPLHQLWYTSEGLYTFSVAYSYKGFPCQRIGSCLVYLKYGG